MFWNELYLEWYVNFYPILCTYLLYMLILCTLFCVNNFIANKVFKIDYLKLSTLSYTFNLKFIRMHPKIQMHFSSDDNL